MTRYKKQPWKALYNTAAWAALRSTLLTEKPICVFCEREGKEVPADVVDHIKEHKGNVDLFYDYDNLQGLCFNHHNSGKQRIEKGGIFVQYGPNGFPLPIRS